MHPDHGIILGQRLIPNIFLLTDYCSILLLHTKCILLSFYQHLGRFPEWRLQILRRQHVADPPSFLVAPGPVRLSGWLHCYSIQAHDSLHGIEFQLQKHGLGHSCSLGYRSAWLLTWISIPAKWTWSCYIHVASVFNRTAWENSTWVSWTVHKGHVSKQCIYSVCKAVYLHVFARSFTARTALSSLFPRMKGHDLWSRSSWRSGLLDEANSKRLEKLEKHWPLYKQHVTKLEVL